MQYRTNAGERRKPALGLYGELTVEQARSLAQEWLAEVRRGGDPGAAKTAARKAPTRKMFSLAEVWGYRPDGTNPCRHVPMSPNGKATHLISDEEMGKLFRYLDFLETDGLGLDHAVLPLAIQLQFEFAGRRSEVVTLQWDWMDLEHRRVVWPDSKTGGMSKPLSEEAHRLLSTAPRQDGCPPVFPSPNHPGQHMTNGEHYSGWTRILKRAGVSHVGTHGIRHRSATDIANSGIPVKVGMALTAHKTVAMFMRYVHTEDAPVRQTAELVASRRKTITGVQSAKTMEAAVGG